MKKIALLTALVVTSILLVKDASAQPGGVVVYGGGSRPVHVQYTQDQPVVAEDEGYTPQYYEGYVVFYDDQARPCYYADDVLYYVPTDYAYYASLVSWYRTYRPYYLSWYRSYGHRYRGYRQPGWQGRPPRYHGGSPYYGPNGRSQSGYGNRPSHGQPSYGNRPSHNGYRGQGQRSYGNRPSHAGYRGQGQRSYGNRPSHGQPSRSSGRSPGSRGSSSSGRRR